MRYLTVLALLVASCSIIPDNALDYIPSSARVKTITFTGYGEDYLPIDEPFTAMVTYSGSFGDPSKIEIEWPSDFQLMRVPIFDKDRRISKTIYELDDWKVSKITNINDQNKTARVETFSYAGRRIRQHVQTNFFNGTKVNTFTNDFFYQGAVLDSVYQQVCFEADTCWAGFLVALNEARGGEVGLYDGCGSGTYVEAANYGSIMPYIPGHPYRFNDYPETYWDPVSGQNYYSLNDFEKLHFSIQEPSLDDYSSSGVLAHFSKLSMYSHIPGESDYTCEPFLFDAGFAVNFPYDFSQYDLFGYQRSAALWYENAYDRHFNPVYYSILQRPGADLSNGESSMLIPQAPVLVALSKKIDFLYYRENASFQDDDPISYDIIYEFDVSGK